uniref:DUF1758 domain-containing protein n=1 Tax=Heterorhabditis bacteriophora TaxID=37862 RepID=A0A1I7XBY6_HETBA
MQYFPQRSYWKCLSTYHKSRKCTRPNCSQCGKEHHRLLCLGNSPEPPNTTHNRETSSSSMQSERRQQKCVSFDQSNNTVFQSPKYDSKSRYEHEEGNNSSRKQQVFMTTKAEIFNHKTYQYEKTIVFFDNGSHLSFIQRAYSTRIGIKPIDISSCTLS